MRTFKEYLELKEAPMPPMGGGMGGPPMGGGLGSPAGLPPGPPMGGGMGGPPPPMGGMGGTPPGMDPMGGGMPPGGAPGGQQPTMKVRSADVWDVLEKVIEKNVGKDHKPSKSSNVTPKPQQHLMGLH